MSHYLPPELVSHIFCFTDSLTKTRLLDSGLFDLVATSSVVSSVREEVADYWKERHTSYMRLITSELPNHVRGDRLLVENRQTFKLRRSVSQ